MNICEATNCRIRELCAQKGISAYRNAFLAGMPPTTYRNILSGRSRNPGIVNINRIADALGVSIREFYDSDLFDSLDA